MEPNLRLLIIEDLSSDVELIERELTDLGQPYELRVVADESGLRRELTMFKPDLVLSDYLLPQFSGIEALKIVQEFDLDLPFIVVTGSMNELTAVECMKAGAWDYVIKEKLNKLVPAIQSALTKKRLIKENKAALRALEESERRFRTLIELAPMAIVVYLNGIIRYVNQVAVKQAGANNASELIGRKMLDFTHPDFREQAEERMSRLLAGQVLDTVEYKLISLDGREIDAEVTSMPLELDGEPAVMSILNDITQRKQAQARYQSLVEQSNDAIYLLYENKFELINRRFTELFGYDLEQCRRPGFSFLDLVAPESRSFIEARMKALGYGEKVPELFEFTGLSKSGQRIVCECSASTINYREGKAVQGIIRDITERKRTEEKIRKLSLVVEQSPISIIITDRAGTIEYVNPAFTRISGYAFDEAVGQNPRLLKSGKTPPEVYEKLWATITAGHVWNGEFINRKKDGSLFWERAVIGPIFDSRGRITHFVGIKEDITETKELREQFLQAQKMEAVGRLAGGIAHDFNNLLTVIIGTVDLALIQLGDDNPLRDALQQIRQAGSRAATLTRQLLAFSRRQFLQPEVLNLNTVVEDMKKILQRLIGEDIILEFMLAKDLGQVRVDPSQMTQVIMNLAINARDAMPTGGRLAIETRNVDLDGSYVSAHLSIKPGSYVLLSVSDTGLGMDEKTRRHIFEPFFTTKKEQGTGLGLSTVYGIVKQSGGSIWVYSSPGKGTTFKIYLPRVDDTAARNHVNEVAMFAHGRQTVLVVEDETAVRHLVTQALESVGYRVFAASSGEEALELLEGSRELLDLLFTDVVLPGMSGRELAAEVQERFPGTKVLYTSGYTDDVMLQHGILERSMHFVAKPFNISELTRRVREILDA